VPELSPRCFVFAVVARLCRNCLVSDYYNHCSLTQKMSRVPVLTDIVKIDDHVGYDRWHDFFPERRASPSIL
jgi:hypothetical protein